MGHLPEEYLTNILNGMDKYERRRLKLLELRDTKCGKNAASLARRIEREPSYVTRMLYPEGKTGKKRIADDMMEVIENAFNLPRGWMDGRQIEYDEAIEEFATVYNASTEEGRAFLRGAVNAAKTAFNTATEKKRKEA